MNENMQLELPAKGKGIIFSMIIDNSNGGFYCSFNKHIWSFCFFFIAFRICFMSEERYNAINAMATLKQLCKTHDIDFSKVKENL